MNININYSNSTPAFYTDDGYKMAQIKLQSMRTPQQREQAIFSSLGYNPWGSSNLYVSPTTSPVGIGSSRSSGSTSPF
jgi:hypothetical protein